MRRGVEVVWNSAVFLRHWAEVGTVLKAALEGQSGDVFGAGLSNVGFFGKRGLGRMLDVAHGGGGARAAPSPAATALAGASSQGMAGVGGAGWLCGRRLRVCHGSRSTLF